MHMRELLKPRGSTEITNRDRGFLRNPFAVLVAVLLAISMMVLAGCSPDTLDRSSSEGDMTIEDEPRELSAEEKLMQAVDAKLASMTIEEKVAQLFIVSPESLTGVGVAVQAGDQTKANLQECPVGGLIYFAQNLENEQQAEQMLYDAQAFAQEVAPSPLFLCVDEEGGSVSRVGGAEGFSARNVGDMADVGAAGDVAEAEAIAQEIGSYLKPLGFNVDFAPVADIAESAQSMMANRSFGADPQLVSDMVAAQMKGFDEAGILCCVKHFPGIGSSSEDSHLGGIYSDKTYEEIAETELRPFQAAVDAGVQFVMVGHISMPNITGDDTPASLSPSIVQDILRNKMGYDGIVVTDSLGMGAVTESYPSDESAVAALTAGCDIPLMPADFSKAYNGVIAAIDSGELSEGRIDESVRRILRVKMLAFPELFDASTQEALS